MRPDYVPKSLWTFVRGEIRSCFEGHKDWCDAVRHLERLLQTAIQDGDGAEANDLRAGIARYKRSAEPYRRELDAWHRLTDDSRMAQIYPDLIRRVGVTRCGDFLKSAAAVAAVSYAEQRSAGNDLVDAGEKVAQAADQLAKLLVGMQTREQHDPQRPLNVVGFLLAATDVPADEYGEENLWRLHRNRILGELQYWHPRYRAGSGTPRIEQIWDDAPSLVDILGTLANWARSLSPPLSQSAVAALASRKLSPKQAFLRAFLTELITEQRWNDVRGLEDLVAKTAHVVLDTLTPVTPQDVRRALTLVERTGVLEPAKA